MIKITTWANGWGAWHVKVATDCTLTIGQAKTLAQTAANAEMTMRGNGTPVTARIVFLSLTEGSDAVGMPVDDTWEFAEVSK